MLVTEQEKLKQNIEVLTQRYGTDRSALMPILQEVQKAHKIISSYAMQQIADCLGLHPVEVHSVVSFYSFLSEKPKGRFVIRLCRTISCDMLGKDKIARQLESDLGIAFGQTTEDGMFTLEWANCLGMCDQGPAMLVNDEIHTHVTPEKVHDILEEYRSRFGIYALERKEH